MEEPEIALPPHTQRRIANYLLNDTSQCLVSSHSPYVIERFDQSQIQILRRDAVANLTATTISKAASLKPKHYKRHARRGVAEAMLGKGVIVAEGVTEFATLQATAEKLEMSDQTLWPLDLSGVTIFSVDGDGDMPNFGAFFKALGLKTFAFYDFKVRKAEKNAEFAANFDINCQTQFANIEQLLISETPSDRHWEMLEAVRDAGDAGSIGIPAQRPAPADLQSLVLGALKSNKGNGFAAQLIDKCSVQELPPTVVGFLRGVYGHFPKPAKPPVLPPIQPPEAAAGEQPVPPPPPGQ